MTSTPTDRDALEATMAKTRAKIAELDEKNQKEALELIQSKRARSANVYRVRNLDGPAIVEKAEKSRTEARGRAVQVIAASDIGRALAEWIAAELNLAAVHRSLDEAFAQVNPDFSSAPYGSRIDPIPFSLSRADLLQYFADAILSAADGIAAVAERTRAAHAADYVEERVAVFNPRLGIVVDPAVTEAPVVVGSPVPVPDERTPEQVWADRGQKVVIPTPDAAVKPIITKRFLGRDKD